MDKFEIEGDLCDSYRSLVNHLLKKYGAASCDYFVNENCKTVNPNISRSKEGLQCHHIDEDKAIMLSSPQYAIKNPFKYQKADRLVYCNILEHLILHVLIVREPTKKSANFGELVGVGGAVNNLIPRINDYYNGYEFKKEYSIKQNEVLVDNFDGYVQILQELLSLVFEKPYLSRHGVTRERLSMGHDGKINQEIYDRLESFA